MWDSADANMDSEIPWEAGERSTGEMEPEPEQEPEPMMAEARCNNNASRSGIRYSLRFELRRVHGRSVYGSERIASFVGKFIVLVPGAA
jgi:hypothetical protein